MKILIIGPLPKDSTTPWNGNTLPIKIMIDEFSKNENNIITVINTGRNAYDSGFSFRRVKEILETILQIPKSKKNVDYIYLSIAESFFGNMRDILIYILCFNKLNKMIIQLLGGANMKNILKPRRSVIFLLNKFFIGKIRGVIVEGENQASIFKNIINKEKVHIIPNFAQNYLFNTIEGVKGKFERVNQLRVLFLSNLLYGKGHQELIDAYLLLNDEIKDKISIDFAGGFSDENEQKNFLRKIEGVNNVKYHGPVNGDYKKELYHNAHIFCLPTYYPYEGQPFCIIEAYAAGCVVITTNHSGIGYIFKDNVNGYEVEKQSVLSLKEKLESVLLSNEHNSQIAEYNFNFALQHYQEKKYLNSIKKVFDNEN